MIRMSLRTVYVHRQSPNHVAGRRSLVHPLRQASSPAPDGLQAPSTAFSEWWPVDRLFLTRLEGVDLETLKPSFNTIEYFDAAIRLWMVECCLRLIDVELHEELLELS